MMQQQATPPSATLRPDRPCDACRRRKSRCVIDPQSSSTCVMCAFHNQQCTYVEVAAPRRRKARSPSGEPDPGASRPRKIKADSESLPARRTSEASTRTGAVLDDYANLQGASLLKKTLGLQNHRHAEYIGLTAIQDASFLDLRTYESPRGESSAGPGSYRKVAPKRFFFQSVDADQPDHNQDIEDADEIESIVGAHGRALIKLYFRIVHPSYPVLHKKVYLEKYERSHREFIPPLLAAVYILALNWWSYSTELAKQQKPDVARLEALALISLHRMASRAKLSTVQAALLLSQRPTIASWQLSCLTVGIAQDLGLHLDCTRWRIPLWERGLRKRLAWAVFMQDTWSALVYGRPPHLVASNWLVQPVTSNDFPESAADEDDEDGSTEVEKGRALFSAMIAITKVLSEVLSGMCSLRAESDANTAEDSLKVVLNQAKPVQLKLRSWYAEVPESLRVDIPTKIGKLNSVGSLQLAYLATEMTIHRRIISSLSTSTHAQDYEYDDHRIPERFKSAAHDPYLISICRSAAKSRLTTALDFISRLKPEHLQSFWYFGSSYDFALIGSFAGLCAVTAQSRDEADFYRSKLSEYKWQLRVWSSGLEVLERASELLNSAVEPVMASNGSERSPAVQSNLSRGAVIVNELSDDDTDDAVMDGGGVDHADYDQFLEQLMNDTPYDYLEPLTNV